MNRLFSMLGVDYRQWKAVSRTLLRTDFRPLTPQAGSYSMRSVAGTLMMALVFGVVGLGAAMVIAINADVRLTGTLTLVYLSLALVTTLLTQHGATMLSAADLVILGPRPVSSPTLFAIRLTNVLFHALLTTTLMAYPPIIAFTLAHGVNVWRGIGGAAAIYAWNLAVTFAVVASHGAVVRLMGAARLQRAVGYAQLVTGVFAYGGFFLVMEAFGGRALERLSMPDGLWTMLAPPSWFASSLEIATGQTTPATLVRVALSIATLAGFAALLHRTLAAGYVERLAAPQTTESRVEEPVSRRVGWLPRFERDEARAVAILTRAHFRHDLRVRMGVFGILPILLLYTILGIREGGHLDPFVNRQVGRGVDLLALAVLMFPAMVTRHLESSDAYRAAWIYTVTAARRGRLVVALKNVAAACFLAPFVAVVAAFFAWRFGHAGHAFTHAALLGLVSHLALQTAVVLRPRLPFAAPPDTRDGAAMFAWMIGVLVGGQLLLVGVQRFVYPSWTRIAAGAAVLLAATWLLERAIRHRAEAKFKGS